MEKCIYLMVLFLVSLLLSVSVHQYTLNLNLTNKIILKCYQYNIVMYIIHNIINYVKFVLINPYDNPIKPPDK